MISLVRPIPLAHVMGQRHAIAACRTHDGVDAVWHPPLLFELKNDRPDYWTVTAIFMFIAMCGTQTTS